MIPDGNVHLHKEMKIIGNGECFFLSKFFKMIIEFLRNEALIRAFTWMNLKRSSEESFAKDHMLYEKQPENSQNRQIFGGKE